MVFELLGRTLLHEIQDRGALEVSETKRCAACLLECLAFVHDEVGVLHTDVKPENVLLAGPAPVGRVKLVDLGTAFYVGRQGARDIQTREYRCPEGVLGLWPFGPAADVWSVGCLVFELLTGETLFDPQSPRPGEPFSKDESHLAQAVGCLGSACQPAAARRALVPRRRVGAPEHRDRAAAAGRRRHRARARGELRLRAPRRARRGRLPARAAEVRARRARLGAARARPALAGRRRRPRPVRGVLCLARAGRLSNVLLGVAPKPTLGLLCSC